MKSRKITYFKYLNLFFAMVILVFITGCTGESPAVPIINSFSASPSTITAGESATLSWSVTNAASVTIDQSVGTVALSGTTTVYPTTTTTYTLTATNTAGSVTATTMVTLGSALTVTYDGNGATAGTVPVDPSSYQSGATVTVLGNMGDLVRIHSGGTSYRFTGWNTQADGSGTDQAGGSTFTMGTSPVILYAQWAPYVLGDIGPAGGYIFYDKGVYSKAALTTEKAGNDNVKILLPPITPTYIGWRYLEAAPASTEWNGIQWGSYETLIGGIETGIGPGQSNTATIVIWLNSHSETGRAAQLCNDLTVEGYMDWFLPSKDELNLMYENLKLQGVGGFAGTWYWSSSEYNASRAWSQSFFYGGQSNSFKNDTVRVRAVRAF
jgi:hypothetical protein